MTKRGAGERERERDGNFKQMLHRTSWREKLRTHNEVFTTSRPLLRKRDASKPPLKVYNFSLTAIGALLHRYVATAP